MMKPENKVFCEDLSLRVNVLASAHVRDALSQMKILSCRLGVMVVAEFNEVELIMTPKTAIDAELERFYVKIRGKKEVANE